jgi:cysteine desulfurase
MHGGAQEAGRRSSTHNVTGIVGLGMATQIAAREMAAEHKRILKQRDHLLDKILQNITDVHLNGDCHERLANNINISIAHVEGESMLMNLDMEGIAVSSGSACSSGSNEPSHVLMALGLSPEMARGSLRITLGRYTTDEEIDRVADGLKQVVSHLRSLSSFGEGT